jgi:hypothetical protein
MNVEIGTEATYFPEKEYIIGILLAVHANNKHLSLIIEISQEGMLAC